jgi:hypothetical protein
MQPRPGLMPAKKLELGPMLVCVDTSGSMQGGAEAVAKAVVLEAMRAAHAQNRACHVFAFGGAEEVVEMELPVDRAGIEIATRFLGQSFSGGTDICAPLEKVIAQVEQERWQRADLLIATDGEFGATPKLAARLAAIKRELGLRVQGVLIADRETVGLLEIADHIHPVRDWRRFGGSRAESPIHTHRLTALYFPGALRNEATREATVSGAEASAAHIIPQTDKPKMSFADDYLAQLAAFAAQDPLPRVRALHLPPPPTGDPGENKGEFCALELDDGSLGLSYVLLDDTLARLRAAGGDLGVAGGDALALARRYASADSFGKALGFATANALTRCLYDRAGFAPPASRDSIGEMNPASGEHIGMIGLFRPLLGRVLESGARLTVVELKAELAGAADGYRVTVDARELETCAKVVSTSTLLLNDTLDQHARPLPQRALVRHGRPQCRLPARRPVRARRHPGRRQLDPGRRRLRRRLEARRIDQPVQRQDRADARHLPRRRRPAGARRRRLTMPTLELLGILVLGGIAWLWYDSVHVREIGIRAAKAACAADELQLLDDTVAIASLSLGRGDEGRLCLRRAYGFRLQRHGRQSPPRQPGDAWGGRTGGQYRAATGHRVSPTLH